ncbi:hypothetical protein [Martelella sp. HB161492]|uniref:hypothetical protein n=1 Tax=Martelella sp. HB161492 TaxID=2720726 RepID=UPI0015923FEB|nr:hypothetical protein [Martelella sp. HB161492]
MPMSLQAEAKPEQIAQLRKDGTQYLLDYQEEDRTITRQAEGAYIFVIKSTAPNDVLIGRLNTPDSRREAEAGLEIAGHTSITKGEDILFAGEVLFANGQLSSWTNRCGHYRPMTKSIAASFQPYVQTLLPQRHYKEVIQEDGSELRDNMIDIANGYVFAANEPDLVPMEPPHPAEAPPPPGPPPIPQEAEFVLMDWVLIEEQPAPAG